MIIRFYNFAKRENSTKQPASGSGTEYNVILKENASLINPVVILRLTEKPVYNYAYIPDMDRFYYIDDIENDGKERWVISMHTDVLASFKVEIGNASLYVLRSAADYDGNIVDNYYPVKVTKTNVRNTVDSLVNAGGTSAFANIDNGCFIVGIVGHSPSSSFNFGSIRYYAIERSQLDTLVTQLLSDSVAQNAGLSGSGDFSLELQKSIIDPLSFIKSCIWVPIAYNDINNVLPYGRIYAGDWVISVNHKQINNNPPQKTLTTTITIPKHPSAATRGNYLNCEPYTRYQLLIPPFGNFELDSTVLTQASTLSITIYLDLLTGVGTLRVSGEGDGQYLINSKTQIGVPINLTQITHDYLGSAGGILGGVVSAGAGLAMGNPVGIIGGVMSAIGSAVNAYKPIVSSMGGNGGFSDLTGRITLAGQFYDVAEEDNANCGRPLCQLRQISTLGGFTMVKEGDVEINGFGSEQSLVKSYLESGFYYE